MSGELWQRLCQEPKPPQIQVHHWASASWSHARVNSGTWLAIQPLSADAHSSILAIFGMSALLPQQGADSAGCIADFFGHASLEKGFASRHAATSLFS